MYSSIPWRLMIWDREKQQVPLRRFFAGLGYEVAPASNYRARSWLPQGHDPSFTLLEIQTDGLDGMRFLEMCDRAKAAWPIDWAIDFTNCVIVLSRRPTRGKPVASDYQAVVASLQSSALRRHPGSTERLEFPVAVHV
jgi:hypothetical protein